MAIKQLNEEYTNWEECKSLPEVESLSVLQHPNIIQLLGVVKLSNRLNLIFERMDTNLCEIIRLKNLQKMEFTEYEILNIT